MVRWKYRSGQYGVTKVEDTGYEAAVIGSLENLKELHRQLAPRLLRNETLHFYCDVIHMQTCHFQWSKVQVSFVRLTRPQ